MLELPYQNSLLVKFILHILKNTSLKDLLIIVNHHRDLLDLILLLAAYLL